MNVEICALLTLACWTQTDYNDHKANINLAYSLLGKHELNDIQSTASEYKVVQRNHWSFYLSIVKALISF